MQWLRLTILIVVLSGSRVALAQLRTCNEEKCQRPALSDTWIYCPYCGTRLPESTIAESASPKVVGNIYKNARHSFQIERPNEQWRFITRRADIAKINDDAEIAIVADDVYCIVIAERMPEVTLADYADLVAPEVEDAVQLKREDVEIGGQPAIRTEWSLKVSGLNLVYMYAILQRGDTFLQVIGWCVKGNDAPETRAALHAIGDSVRFSVDSKRDEVAPEKQEGAPAKDAIDPKSPDALTDDDEPT